MILKNLRNRGMLAATCVGLVLAFAAPASADSYTALGDSYASGTGSSGTTLNASCDRRSNAYPNLIAQQRANTTLTFVACSGATTTDVMSNQISSVTSSTNVVTVQIGGNDIGFANLILACTFGNCTSNLTSAKTSIPSTLPSKLDTVYSAIKARAPLADVTVVGYPSPAGSKTCSSGLGISAAEVTGINAVAGVLRDTIKARALSYGFDFADPLAPFVGHDVCSSSPWINGFSLSTGMYHPNANGQKLGFAPLVKPFLP